MTKLKLWLSRQRASFLGRFAEVRKLRQLESDFRARAQELYAKELEHRKATEQAETARARMQHELEETKRALSLMTEARLQADRAVEVLRGELQAVQEVTEREIGSMKQMVDWFGLEGRGRQVFGTAPLQRKVTEEEPQRVANGIQARRAVQQLTTDFIKQAEERLRNAKTLEGEGPEYSSTSRAVSEDSAA